MSFDTAIANLIHVFGMTDLDNQRMGYYRCLYEYAELLPANAKCIEIGTNEGRSAAIIGSALRDRGGKLWTIDPVFITGDYECQDGILEKHTYNCDLATVRKRLDMMGLQDTVSIIAATSHDAFDEWVKQPEPDRLIDFLYVDGEHSYPGVREDCRWMDVVNINGFAAFDDWTEHVTAAVLLYMTRHYNWRIIHESTQPNIGNWSVTLLRRFR